MLQPGSPLYEAMTCARPTQSIASVTHMLSKVIEGLQLRTVDLPSLSAPVLTDVEAKLLAPDGAVLGLPQR